MRRVALLVCAAVGLWLAPGALAAGWCGSGESSTDLVDAVTGRQIHAVVVNPSDGPDTFAVDADRITVDVASIAAWWTGQDPTRAPRFDQAVYLGGTCLDISYLRLPVAGSALNNPNAVFDDIADALEVASQLSVYKRYLVYYDGPAPAADVCGVGDGNFATGPGLAVVLPTGCPGVPTDTVATHELLHALGAVPPGDPHACPTDAGHPCDSPSDVLYPFTRGEPLSQKVLDVGHDDYYGHSGSWDDLQDSLWLGHLDTPQEALGVTLRGAGAVVSDVPGVACSAACTTRWDQGSTVGLTAKPATSERFVGWQGACTGVTTCQVTLGQPQSVNAVFGPLSIPVRVAVKGKGRVACVPACSNAFSAGSRLTLRAVAGHGWRFVGWGGGCKGARLLCRPATDFALTIRATFRKKS